MRALLPSVNERWNGPLGWFFLLWLLVQPEIMADAAYEILCKNSKESTGNFFIDDDVLRAAGQTEEDLEQYAVTPGGTLAPDFFI